MKRIILGLLCTSAITLSAQNNSEQGKPHEDVRSIDMENGVTGIADNRGFTLKSKDNKFVFKPYLFLQSQGKFQWYDSEGLDKAYNQDNVANSGFAMPYAILGFTGTTFGRVDYNLCINASASGVHGWQVTRQDCGTAQAAASTQPPRPSPTTSRYQHCCMPAGSPSCPGAVCQRHMATTTCLAAGTASIDNKGSVVHPGDIVSQTHRMWQNVEALLRESGMDYDDVMHLIVYLRDTADYATVSQMFRQRFPNIPTIIVYAPVCRLGWLIEMECIAIASRHNPQYAGFATSKNCHEPQNLMS